MFIIACCIPRGSQPAWLLGRFSQATIRTADGAATLIGPTQRNFARRKYQRQRKGESWKSLGMDRTCGAAPAKRRKEDTCRWTVPVARLQQSTKWRQERPERPDRDGRTQRGLQIQSRGEWHLEKDRAGGPATMQTVEEGRNGQR